MWFGGDGDCASELSAWFGGIFVLQHDACLIGEESSPVIHAESTGFDIELIRSILSLAH